MSEKKNIAIQLSGVKKMYKLGQIGGGTLQGDLQSWWARVRHIEDPNLKIGQEQRQVGQTFFALNGIDLTIYQGEAVGIIGSNGAGKSTMLKLLSRVTAPTEGEIDIYGRIASMLEVGTGFHGEMTGRENVYMNGAILGMSKAEIDAKMEDIIEFSEVREFIDTPVKRYSSGMYVKLAFSVAAHLESEIMIMDEVLAVGDMAFQKKCLNKMRDAAKKEGRTVLYVSHNMNTIRQLCDRCIVLDQGRVVFEGEVEKAINAYLGISSEISIKNDCLKLPREPIGDHKMMISYIELLDTNRGIVYDTQELSFLMKYTSEFEFKNLACRVILFNSANIPVGMCASNAILPSNIEENMIECSINLPNLSEGQYFGRVVLYEVDTYANELIHDVVQPGFTFVKNLRNVENDTSKRWNQSVWGNIVVSTMKVKNKC